MTVAPAIPIRRRPRAPEIPPNTGNVIRLTANTATDLHLVEPLGFRMDDRDLQARGARLPRVSRACASIATSPPAVPRSTPRRRAAGSRSRRGRPASLYDDALSPEDVLVFGRIDRASPRTSARSLRPTRTLRIPMRPGVRSLNLSNAVAVAVYEAWRQNGFAGAELTANGRRGGSSTSCRSGARLAPAAARSTASRGARPS